MWQHQFEEFEDARRRINPWMRGYNKDRQHLALQYKSPRQYRKEQYSQVCTNASEKPCIIWPSWKGWETQRVERVG
ncbi:integrase core domain-containing protein [Candidatus Nitrospira neomarina]|uniref:integrase core domain-containing protein n=1 Tax=Candidatus Nitrospira neomarina TaxID=3020899 RepID=UPI0035E3EF27